MKRVKFRLRPVKDFEIGEAFAESKWPLQFEFNLHILQLIAGIG
jgi:hypothetical protein